MKVKDKILNLRVRFKESMKLVSEILSVKIEDISRDQYIRVTVDTDIKSRLNKEELNSLGGFKVSKNMIIPKKSKEEIEKERLEELKSLYVEYIENIGITPSVNVIRNWGFTPRDISKYFGSQLNMYNSISKENPNLFSKLVNDSIFTEEYFNNLKKSISKSKRFIITTAVSGKEVDPKALASIDRYNKVNNSKLLILPCEDVASRSSIFKYELDSRLRSYGFIFRDLHLNDNLYISSIAVSAKQIDPLTGLERLAQAKGSALLASPKQRLKFVATSNTKLPHALMTTGAITVNDYSTDKAMSQRTSYIAEFDHVMGAIIVEIQDNDIYHFRQIQFDENGEFYDLGMKYKPEGIEKVKETVCVFGDTHVGSHSPEVNECLKLITSQVKAKEVIIHDLFDNRFNNHHNIGKVVSNAILRKKGLTSLMKEGMLTRDWLDEWSSLVKKLTIVKSNHDEALDRYINEGRWAFDEENLYDAILLVRAKMEGKDPLEFLISEMLGLKKPKSINWLNRNQDYKIYGIENGAHGDKAANGSKGSLKGIENSYFKATVGHSHTAGILRNIYQVGTSTYMELGYNVGPSSWTHSMCIQYPNGQRQLINIIKDKNDNYKYCI